MIIAVTAPELYSFELTNIIPTPQRILKDENKTLRLPEKNFQSLQITSEVVPDTQTFIHQCGRLLKWQLKTKVNPGFQKQGKYIMLWPFVENWKGPGIWPSTTDKKSGYTLGIYESGIVLSGNDREGFFYGLQSLLQIALLATEKRQDIPAAVILDWPDIARRAIKIDLSSLHSKSIFNETPFMRLAALKYNSVFIYLQKSLPGTKFPFPKTRPNPLSKTQIDNLKRILKKYHIKLNLAFQFGSHCSWLSNEPAYRQFIEQSPAKPIAWNCSNWCQTNPKLWEFVEDMLKRQIELCQPESILIGHDELHGGNIKTCPRCKKSTLSKEELIAHGIKKCHQIIRKNGKDIKIIVWYDQFISDSLTQLCGANVSDRDGEKILNMIPRDIEIALWRYHGDPVTVSLIEYFKKHNRKFWLATFLAGGERNNANYACQYGAEGIIETLWYAVKGFLSDPSIARSAMHAIVGVANSSWNANTNANLFINSDPVHLFYLLGHGAKKSSGIPEFDYVHFSETAKDNKSKSASSQHKILQKILRSIPRGHVRSTVNNIPFEIQNKPIVLASTKNTNDNHPVKSCINVDKKVNAVHFLHFCNIYDNSRNLDDVRTITQAPKIAEYRLHFKNKVVKLPLHYRWEITDWNNNYSGFKSPIALKIPLQNNIRGIATSYSWYVTGEKPLLLEKIDFISDAKYGMNPVLLGVTLETNKLFQGKLEKSSFNTLAIRDDFEYKTTKELRKKWNFNKNPKLAEQGSMLKIDLPATKFSRTDIGMKFNKRDLSESNAVSFRVYIDRTKESTVIPYIYLGNTKQNYYYCSGLGIPKDCIKQWYQVIIPFRRFYSTSKIPKGFGLNNINLIKISFWHKNKTADKILIDDFKVGYYEGKAIYNHIK
jgi:hypothetical protein